ncbi:MAG: TonB-dependent receptor, partial [Candidatus Binataceae bacterium]
MSGIRSLAYLLLIGLIGTSPWGGDLWAADPSCLEGLVRDPSGASVSGAEVSVSGKDFRQVQTTDREGKFVFTSVSVPTAKITVRASGFAPLERAWSTLDSSPVEIVLQPLARVERITVTATRTEQRVSETAASVTVLTSEDLAASAAPALDDALRQVPGFALFRRTGSRTANPTSQGVSLRGVGASGASRALVLSDGVPLNDPFGGWVYWDRVPRASVGAIEVVRGGASDLYGTGALGGVVNIIPRRVQNSSLWLEAAYGSEKALDVSAATYLQKGNWRTVLSAERFRTDGYILVEEQSRGVVDTQAGSEHSTAEVTLERKTSERSRVFARGSLLHESRRNGTPLQTNRTHFRQLALGGDWQSDAAGTFSLRAYGGPQVYDQTFSAVASDRAREALNRIQRVPAQQVGLSGQWTRAAGSRQTLVAGFDGREVRGTSDELGFAGGQTSTALSTGGRQRSAGLFGESIFRLTPRWMIQAGLRFDHWRNSLGVLDSRPLLAPGPGQTTRFPLRTESAISPRLAVLHRLTENVVLSASTYRAFRAPTLNELYRSFRVGNVLTRANPVLEAERLTGAEVGASAAAFHQRLTTRFTFFWSHLSHPVANVTLDVQPNLITRQRQNLGSTRSRGLEFDFDARVSDSVTVSGGYQFAGASVLRFPADATLEGLHIPHVPRHVLVFQTRYAHRRWLAALQARYSGAEFDDDQNRLRLNRYFELDALASRSLGHGVEAFAAVENLLNQRYDVARTPVRTIGPPTLVRIGVRLALH